VCSGVLHEECTIHSREQVVATIQRLYKLGGMVESTLYVPHSRNYEHNSKKARWKGKTHETLVLDVKELG
jgi:hypothetical protein